MKRDVFDFALRLALLTLVLAVIAGSRATSSEAQDEAASRSAPELRSVPVTPKAFASSRERAATLPDDGLGVRVDGNRTPAVASAASLVPETSTPVLPSPTGEVGTALIGGTISYVDAKYGPSYLALPFPRGTVATVCGPADCVTRRSTDFGPDQRVHPNRIADVSAADFTRICGVPLSAGLCRGTVEIEPPVSPDDDRMRAEDGGPTLPPTDQGGPG